MAFLGAAFFLLAAALVAGAEGAVLLVTRPDLVFPRTTGAFSSTAGACIQVSTSYSDTGVKTYGSALSNLGDIGLGLGCFGGCGGLLGGSGLGCGLGSGLLGCSSLFGRCLLCSSLIFVSMRISQEHGVFHSQSSWPWQQSLAQPW